MAKRRKSTGEPFDGTLFRHGDVLIMSIPEGALPRRLLRRAGAVLVEGEVTGHAHRVETDDPEEVELFEDASGVLYLRVKGKKARVVHEEHAQIELSGPALYRVWQQREYDPRRHRRVVD